MANKVAGRGKVYVCGVCGKRSKDRYGMQAISRGWEESCMSHCFLAYEKSLKFDDNGVVIEAESVPALWKRFFRWFDLGIRKDTYFDLHRYDGAVEKCSYCGRQFQVGEVVSVSDDPNLVFCYVDDRDCSIKQVFRTQPPRMLATNPYVYRNWIPAPGTLVTEQWARNRKT